MANLEHERVYDSLLCSHLKAVALGQYTDSAIDGITQNLLKELDQCQTLKLLPEAFCDKWRAILSGLFSCS